MRPFGADRVDVDGHVVAAHEIEGDVRAAAGRFDDGPRERVDVERAVGRAGRFDADVETQRAATIEFRGGARGPDDACAPRVCELQRGGADARTDRVHQHPLARGDLCLGHQCVVHRDVHLGHAAHRDEVEIRRDDRAVHRRHGDVLRLRAAADDPEDAIADRARRDVGADRFDDTGELHARDVDGNAGRRGIATGALQEIGAVQTGAVNPHHDPVRSRVGDGPGGDLQMAVDDRDCPHEPAT